MEYDRMMGWLRTRIGMSIVRAASLSELTSYSANIDCYSEGVQPDQTNCQSFYKCIDLGFSRDNSISGRYQPIKYSCNSGMVFDPATGTCVHAARSSRPECRQLNYAAWNGHTANFVPASNFLFRQSAYPVPSSESGSPNESESNGYPAYEYPDPSNQLSPNNQYPAPQQPSATESPEDGSYSGGNEESNPEPNAPPPPPSPPCTAEGFYGIPNECQSFYRCVGQGNGQYLKYNFRCSSGTVWDDVNQACNHPWAVSRADCKTDAPEPEPEPSPDQGKQTLSCNRRHVMLFVLSKNAYHRSQLIHRTQWVE
ncbi:hypothetical protein WDU94_007557 [Cyamophila willieti]